jgi:DNA-binding CsgD family transcriptional regulator
VAARLYGAAEALTAAVGLPLVVPPPGQYRRAVEALRRELGADAFAAAWAAGRALPLEQAVAEALEAVDEGAGAPSTPGEPHGLSPREREIVLLLGAGQTNRAIGEALFISERTVDTHVARIFRKLAVRTRSEAIAAARAAGLLTPPPTTPTDR